MNKDATIIFLEGFALPLLAVVFVWLLASISLDWPIYRIVARIILAVGDICCAYQFSQIATSLKQKCPGQPRLRPTVCDGCRAASESINRSQQ